MVIRPINPSSTQPAAITNKGAAATAYIRGIQAALALKSVTLRALVMDTRGT